MRHTRIKMKDRSLPSLPALLIALTGLAGSFPSAGQSRPQDLTMLSLEELMNVEVLTATRKPGLLSEIPAAIDVVTAEDIRRSGAMNIPDALRGVPGMEVARVDANKWAVSARGFNSIYSNKLLVLLDGRSLYSPIFSGVFWESHDLLMEDVSRIEVIRGPGATLWGAGAMNGIVNIVSRDAGSTPGLYLDAGGGTEELRWFNGRFGGFAGKRAAYRVYARHSARGGFENTEGGEGRDDWRGTNAGFRVDLSPARRDHVTVQAEGNWGNVGQEGAPTLVPGLMLDFPDYRTETQSQYGLVRWRRTLSDHSDFAVRVSLDRTQRRDTLIIGGRYTTLDVDGQHHFRAGRHDAVWGFGFRVTRNRMDADLMAAMNPRNRTFRTFSAFLQDEIDLVRRRLRLTAGTKVELNDFTGFEVQPNARLMWMPLNRHSFWAAASRAVRLPDPADYDLSIHYDMPMLRMTIKGNPDLAPEELTAVEFGWQVRPAAGFKAGVNAYHNVYRNVHAYNIGEIRVIENPAAVEIPFFLDNAMSGTVTGAEFSAEGRIGTAFRCRMSVSGLDMRLDPSRDMLGRFWYFQESLGLDKDIVNAWLKSKEGKSPDWMGSLRCSWNASRSVDVDVMARIVDELPGIAIPSYTGVDARVAYRPASFLELYVTGQNLVRRTHREFDESPAAFGATAVERGVYGGASFRFVPR
ncbi:TonB-dependent receptor [bacterium]|nr:TonB-dependent receptor [bacterium]